VRRLLRDADRTRHTAAARIADAIVAEYAVPVSKGWLLHKGREPTGEDAGMHQHDGLPGSPYLVREFDAFENCPIQVPLFHDVPPF